MTETVNSLFKPDEKKAPDKKEEGDKPASGLITPPRPGDTGHADTSGGGTHDSSEDAFRAAIGLESGNRGNTRYTTEQFNRDLGQGAGISRGQVVKFTDASGREIQGGQYHNSAGTFFKTPEGEKYRVDQSDGKYTLQPTRDGQQPITASSREVISNNFTPWRNRPRDNDGDGGDNNSGRRNRYGDGDGDNNGGRTRPRSGEGDGDNNGGRTRPRSGEGDGDATTRRPGKDGEAAVVPAVPVEKAPAVVPVVPTDKTTPVVPAVTTDKTTPVVPVATTTGDHTTPVVPAASTAARLDPTAFYNQFKGTTDADRQQRAELINSIPQEKRKEFLTQVAEVALRTDRAGADGLIKDIKQTVFRNPAVDNPGANPDRAVVTPATPVKVDGTPTAPQVIKDGTPIKDNPTRPIDVAQFVRDNPQFKPGDNPQLRPGGDPSFKPGGDPTIKVVTSVDGVIIKDGRGGQPGDGFKPDGGTRVDAAAIIAKLQNPGDGRPMGPDGKPFQPVDVVRGHGDGKDNPNPAQLAGRGPGGDQAQPLMPQQKIPGLDLNDPQTKQFLADALKQIQANKVGDFDPRNQHQNLQDILKGLDPHKIDRLQAFLNPDGKGPISDAAVGKLAAILNPTDRITGSAATDITLGQKTAIDRLTELVRGNQNLIDLQTLQTKDGRLLQEINRMVGDVNKQFGFEGKNVLTLSDIIGRSLDGTKGGERGLGLEGKGVTPTNLDPLSFTAKLTPQQEQAIRAFLDMKDSRLADVAGKNANVDTHATLRPTDMLGRPEPKVETSVRAELANRADQKADAKHEPTAKELAASKELAGKDLAAKEQPGKELAGKPDLTGKPELTGKDLGAKAELGAKGDLITKGEMAGKQDGIVRPDQIVRPDGIKDIDKGDKLDPQMPFGKNDGINATNLDGSKKVKDEKELAEKKQDEKERLEEEQQRKEAALLALMADRKIREDKEKAQKEADKLQQEKKQQDEDSRRRRYVVRERDTLESIASKQHRDGKLAPLIFEINKKEIAMKIENGKEVADLRPRQVIWLPSAFDIREFRKRMHSGSTSQSAGDGKLTAEDELAARFGTNWDGTTSGDGTESSGDSSIAAAPALSPEAVAATQSRRANIEKLLGPLSKQRPADGRIRYVVRLGDTLKAVAMKHPSLQDISLWPLLAEVNEISTETDEKGVPLAKLSRGSTVMIPTTEEIQSYRDKNGAKANPAARATKPCPHCGRASAIGASICGACAHSFNLETRPNSSASDAGMVVMQAAGFVQKPGVPLAKRPIAPETTDIEVAPVIPAPLYPDGSQLAVVQLDEQTRLTRCMIHGETPSTVVVIEVCRDNSWRAVVAYEIFSQSSMRHEYNPRGERKSVKIDLPTEAILELSNNDLKTNWKNYRDRYFAQLISLNR